MRIIDLDPGDEKSIHEIARMLVDAFREGWPDAWASVEEGLETVRESFENDGISRVAVDEEGRVLGWIGGISDYDGNVWELHPLVVAPAHQGQGVGRALVADLEDQVRSRGGITVTLGSDDVSGMTTLYGADLYQNVWEHIEKIRNLRGHPFEFYQKLGYVIVGVVPDANGTGKPDILMAKRVASSEQRAVSDEQ